VVNNVIVILWRSQHSMVEEAPGARAYMYKGVYRGGASNRAEFLVVGGGVKVEAPKARLYKIVV